MPWEWPVGAVCAFALALIATPAGVSGAVLLLPVQLSLLGVPSPAVTPTNLLFNVVATPGALLRYRRRGSLATPLTRLMLLGTLPGVVVGATVRVLLLPGERVFRLVVAALLLPLGAWLCATTVRRAERPPRPAPAPRSITTMALAVGVVGGIYGVGGGSILGPVLVGRGLPVAVVAPAALASTFLTSVVGALTYAGLALTTSGDIAPIWNVGLLCGLGGLGGGYVGAWLQPRLPERALRLLLGTLAALVSLLYVVESLG